MGRSVTTRGDESEMNDAVRAELVRRLKEIEAAYQAAARRMGQLYMYADAHAPAAFTRRLDSPMRSAADNERAVAALIDELQMNTKRHEPGKKPA